MPRERIDLSSDISFLLAQLKRLAASRLGRRLGLGALIFVDPELAQAIIDIDAAVQVWGDRGTKEEWKALKRRIVRKAALLGLRKMSESTQLFVAASGEGEAPSREAEIEEEEEYG